MFLVLHITIALSSLLSTSVGYLKPSETKQRVSYGLIAATLASGTYLVWLHPANLKSSCISGLVYISVVTFGTLLSRNKLRAIQQTND